MIMLNFLLRKGLQISKRLISKSMRLLFVSSFLVLLDASVLAAEDVPSLGDIFDTLVNILNLAIFVVGGVFVIMLAYGAFKASMSLGDPKGLEAAKATWINTIIGVFIVVGVFVIFNIVLNFFNIGGVTGIGIFDRFSEAVNTILGELRISL